jgi:hypothetical protein
LMHQTPANAQKAGLCALLLSALLALAACAPAQSDIAPLPTIVEAKVLATVYLSPTPDAAQAQATLLAQRAVQATPAPTVTPSPTVYVGVFLQGAPEQDSGIPVIDPTLIGLPPEPPTPQPPVCPDLPVDERLGTAWLNDPVESSALGCPIEVAIPFEGAIQVFERGVMYYQPGGAIWAIAPGFITPGRYWTLPRELPPVDPSGVGVVPPPGLRLPEGALASVYFGVEGVREALGFAQLEEQRGSLIYQRFANGTVFTDLASGQAFILSGANDAHGPF